MSEVPIGIRRWGWLGSRERESDGGVWRGGNEGEEERKKGEKAWERRRRNRRREGRRHCGVRGEMFVQSSCFIG